MTTLVMTEKQKYNFGHLNKDAFWWGILGGSTLGFISIYLARLGATPQQLGLLAAGPAVINLLISLPAGNYLKEISLFKATFWTSLAFRLGYLILVPLPIIFSNKDQIWIVILVYLIAAIPGTILAISFNALFADIVEPKWRPTVVGKRNALLSLSLMISTLLSGFLLDNLVFPFNYQVVFAIGTIGALMSSYHLFRFKPVSKIPERIGRPLLDLARPGNARLGKGNRKFGGTRYLTRIKNGDWLMLDLLKGPFGKFLLAYLFFYIFQYLPAPLFPIYLVHDLGLSDGTISIAAAFFYGAMLLLSLALSKIIGNLGNKKSILLSSMSFGLFPLMIVIWPGTAMILIAHIVGGMSWGFAGGVITNNLMDKVPEDNRPPHMALNHVAVNIGILVGSMLGPLLGNLTGIRTAIIISGVLRVLAGVLLGAWS